MKRNLLRLVTVLATVTGLATGLTQVASADDSNIHRVDGLACLQRSDFLKVYSRQAPDGQICFASNDGKPGGIAVKIWDVTDVSSGANTADITMDGHSVHLTPNGFVYKPSGPFFVSYIHLG